MSSYSGLISHVLSYDILLGQLWDLSDVPRINQFVDEQVILGSQPFDRVDQAIIVRGVLDDGILQLLDLILQLVSVQVRSHPDCVLGTYYDVERRCWNCWISPLVVTVTITITVTKCLDKLFDWNLSL